MIIDTTPKPYRPGMRDWHTWYAWYPVAVAPWKLAWLQPVQRRYVIDSYSGAFKVYQLEGGSRDE